MGFFNDLLDDEPKKEKNISGVSEDELDLFGLDDEEKELVRKGENDPWDFDEDASEEDYSEDKYE